MAGSDCSSATRIAANGASRLTYGSGARSGASETNPTCVPGPFRAGADTMSVSGERSTAAPPSAGRALRRDTVPRASLMTTARASPVQPTSAGRRSKLSASGRTAPSTGETSTTRNVSAYLAGASETVAPIRRPPKLAQLSGHVGEPLRRRSVERHAPHVPLPRSVRGEGEPAPVRRPGRGARWRLDPSGRPRRRAIDGIYVHGRPPLTRLRVHHRLGHFDGRPAPVRRNRHAPHAFDRERQLRRPACNRGLHARCEEENQRGGQHEVAI